MNRPKAVILSRVSSKAQEDEGYSLDSQIKLLQKYCSDKDFQVIKIFKISETASKQQSRKIFKELLKYLKQGKIEHLAVEKTDRLTRNMKDAVLIDEWLEADPNRRLHAVKENLLLHKEAKSDVKFMWNIHLAVAKKYTDNLREEAMKGWAEKLAQGWLPAPPPVGYKTVVENGKRIHVPNELTKQSIRKAFRLYLEQGQSVESVAEAMKKMGLTTRRGKPISPSGVHLLLQNPFYIGINRFDGKDYPGAQTPIISEDLFNTVQEKMKAGRPERYVHHNPLLKGLMTCQLCGRSIIWQRQRGKLYGNCQRGSAACKKRSYVRESDVEKQVAELLQSLVCPDEKLMSWVVQTLEKEFREAIDNSEEVEHNLKLKINRIKRMDEMLYDDKLSGEISRDRYDKKHAEFLAQIEELDLELANLDSDMREGQDDVISIVKLTQKAREKFEQGDVDDKRAIMLKLFKEMTVDSKSVSVKLTEFAQTIAAFSVKSRKIRKPPKGGARTGQNDKNNSGEYSLSMQLHPEWQG